MGNLLFKNAHVIDPSQKLDTVGDVLVVDGKIADFGKALSCSADNIINASGLVLAPGLIDLHVHLRDPGLEYKEDIISGCRAAAAGGVTTVCAMPNTKPVCDNAETVKYILEKAANADAHVLPIGAVSVGENGEKLTDMQALKEAGCCAFSDDGVPVKTAELMREALKEAARLDMPVFAHCEEKTISRDGIVNECDVAKDLNMPQIPVSAEDVGTARETALLMSAPKNARLHICHVSTGNSALLIASAKRNGFNVTAETCPHYFIFNDEKLLLKDADYRMNPPLRSAVDQFSVLYSLIDGVIDVIATDHAPHSPEEKADFYKAPNGVIGMETSFSASYTALVASGLISLYELIDKMACKPAEILNRPIGTLKKGSAADIILIDESEKFTVDINKLHGKSKNCIFKNRELQGKVKMTVLSGRIVYNDLGD